MGVKLGLSGFGKNRGSGCLRTFGPKEKVTGEVCIMKASELVFLAKNWDQIKVNEMGGMCSMHGREEN
jgi:hypothetical protein